MAQPISSNSALAFSSPPRRRRAARRLRPAAHRQLSAAYRLHFSTTPRTPAPFGASRVVSTHTLTSFSIFPTDVNTIAQNDLLWRTARTGQYDPLQGDSLFKVRVLALGLPPLLDAFLSSVTQQELHTAIVDFLTLLHHQLRVDGDAAALDAFMTNVHPPLLQAALRQAEEFPTGEPGAGRRADVLEQAVQLCFLTPWQVPVFGAYVMDTAPKSMTAGTPPARETRRQLMGDLGDEGEDGDKGNAGDMMMPCVTSLTDMLVRLHVECDAGIDPEERNIDDGNAIPSAPREEAAVLKLQRDWHALNNWLRHTGLPARGTTEALQRALSCDMTSRMTQTTRTVASLWEKQETLLSVLPLDVVELCLLPWLVRRELECVAPTNTIATSASLRAFVQLSGQLMEQVQGDGDGEDMADELGDGMLDWNIVVESVHAWSVGESYRVSSRNGSGMNGNFPLVS